MGGEFQGEWMHYMCVYIHVYVCMCIWIYIYIIYVCMAESLRCSPETITTLSIPQYKIKSLKNKNIGQLILVPKDSHLPCVI